MSAVPVGEAASAIRAWPTSRLGDLADHRLGKMLDKEKNTGSPRKYLRNPNVKWFDCDLTEIQEILVEDRDVSKYELVPGDVLICEGGEAGRAAIWKGEIDGVIFQKACHRVRVGNKLNARFLVHRLLYDYYSGRLEEYYTGVTIKHLTGQDLARYEFPLPPVNEQRRIAAILDGADALRRKRRRALELFDELTHSVFQQMFGDPKAASGRWENFDFDAACSDVTSRSGKLQRTKYLGKGRFPIVDQGQKLIAGWGNDDELVTRVRNPVIVFGDHTRIVKFIDFDFIVGADGAKIIEPSASYEPLFFLELLRRMPIPDLGYSRHMRALKDLRFVCPPRSLQIAFVQRYRLIRQAHKDHSNELHRLDTLFASLQHRAFTGQL